MNHSDRRSSNEPTNRTRPLTPSTARGSVLSRYQTVYHWVVSGDRVSNIFTDLPRSCTGPIMNYRFVRATTRKELN